jgi:hypothetical protein
MAVFYRCLAGSAPPPAANRTLNDELTLPVGLARTLPPGAIDVLYAALQLYPQRRTQSVESLLCELFPREFTPAPPQPEAPAAPVLQPDEEEEAFFDPEPPQKKETSAGLLGLEAFLAILVIGTMLFCTLYSTVLYTKMEIPLLDSILAPLTFLPLNSDDDTTAAPTRPTGETEENKPVELVLVPNVMNMTYSDLQGNLDLPRNFDFRIEFDSSETVRKNAVISQSVNAGLSVPKGTTLIVTVSSGKPLVTLPDVVGYNYLDAYEMLTGAGFDVKKVMLENDGTHEVGIVYTMSLVAGLQFEKGTSVTLSVWDATGLVNAP